MSIPAQTPFAILLIFIAIGTVTIEPVSANANTVTFESTGQSMLDAQDEDSDASNKPKSKKSNSKIKFSQWDDFLVWLASSEKWNPIIKRMSSVMRFIFSGTSTGMRSLGFDSVQYKTT